MKTYKKTQEMIGKFLQSWNIIPWFFVVVVIVCLWYCGFNSGLHHLLTMHSMAWATPQPFYLWLFLIQRLTFCLASLMRWVLWTFCPDWPKTAVLPTSDSQIARITYHWHMAKSPQILMKYIKKKNKLIYSKK
jgi:hypothetical protein